MQVMFSNGKLQRCSKDLQLAVRTWGEAAGHKYMRRIALLLAAERLEDLFEFRSLRLHKLQGKQTGQFAITIHDRWRLIVKPESVDVVWVLEVSRHYGD